MKNVMIKHGSLIISKNTRLLTSVFELMSGLMFKKEGEVLLKWGSESISMTAIHTFFCFPLVVAWLDKDLKVVDVQRTKPWNHYKSKKPAMYVFETTNMKKKINVGEKWKIIFQ